ncbi:MAG: TlpA family protein disulfide reductase [Isosphaerales bacterium]
MLPFDRRSSGDHSSRLAFARADVIVPEIPGGRSDLPLDIGAVPLAVFPVRELKVGDAAPALTPKAADGRPLDLQALRGRFVLLAFWATYRNLDDIPHLKATYEAFGREPGLVMIGLSQDIEPDTARRYATHRGLAWEQRYLGRSDADPVAAAFGMRHPPQVILIGPDGRLVARDLQGDGIKQAVAKALGRKD